VTAPEVVPCGHCGRPLTDPDSRALGYGPICAAGVLGLDTHRTPVPRGPRRRKDANQIPLPLEAPVSDEISRILAAARRAAPNAGEYEIKRITRAVLEELDELIGESDMDSTWPDAGDLGLLAVDLKEDA
jgi:hypothetical protein